VKISIDKIDQNSRVGVMFYPSVEKILACFPNAALLYQVNTVRLTSLMGAIDTIYTTTYALLVPLPGSF
jgi:hypothetical protein